MRRFLNDTYALNETLLDKVETDEVNDETNGYGQTAEYRFMFHFNFRREHGIHIIDNIFISTCMEPVLEMLVSRGIVSSWSLDDKSCDQDEFPLIEDYAQRIYGMSAKAAYNKKAVVRSVRVYVPTDDENAECLCEIVARMMQYVIASGVSDNGFVRMAFQKIDENKPPQYYNTYCVFYDSGNEWIFHCGNSGNNENFGSSRLAGCFIRIARTLGIMEAADDNASRYVAYSFGKNTGYENMFIIDSGGNVLEQYIVDIANAVHGKYLDNGLMYVKLEQNRVNYLKMDGSMLIDGNLVMGSRDFNDGYAAVSRKIGKGPNEYNLIDSAGNTLLDEWCWYVGDFVDGVAPVTRLFGSDSADSKMKMNVVDTSGKFISKEWYDSIRYDCPELGGGRRHDVALVVDTGNDSDRCGCNYIDRSGKLLLDKFILGDCDVMKNGFAKLCKSEGTYKVYNYMRSDGSIVSEDWFKGVCGWPEHGVFAALVKHEDGLLMWEFRSSETNSVLFGGTAFWSVYTKSGNDGFMYYEVTLNDPKHPGRKLCNLISADGVMCCSGSGFMQVKYMGNGFVSVLMSAEYRVMLLLKWGSNGVVIDRNVIGMEEFSDGYAMVKSLKSKYNFIGEDGKLVSDVWFELVFEVSHGGFAVVGMTQDSTSVGVLACKSGNIIFDCKSSKMALNHIYAVVADELVVVEAVDRGDNVVYNMFDADGNKLLDEWTRFRIADAGSGIVKVGPASYVDYSGKTISLI